MKLGKASLIGQNCPTYSDQGAAKIDSNLARHQRQIARSDSVCSLHWESMNRCETRCCSDMTSNSSKTPTSTNINRRSRSSSSSSNNTSSFLEAKDALIGRESRRGPNRPTYKNMAPPELIAPRSCDKAIKPASDTRRLYCEFIDFRSCVYVAPTMCDMYCWIQTFYVSRRFKLSCRKL